MFIFIYYNLKTDSVLISSEHGTLTLQTSGSYDYIKSANATTTEGNVTDVFTYSITAGDGDISETTLTIKIADEIIVDDTDDNTLTGSIGNEILAGGQGSYTLMGGGGNDIFVWNTADKGTAGTPSHDVVIYFDSAEGDVLNLSDLLADSSHTIEGIEVGGVGSEHLQLNIKNSDGNVVQEIELSGVATAGNPDVILQSLLNSGAIDDGII